jgi:hypothetical protein
MRWALSVLLGAALIAIGIAELAHEVVHGSDVWRRHGLGIGLVILGGCCAWNGLVKRAAGGGAGKPILPAVTLIAVLLAVAGGLYALSPIAAVLFGLIVAPFGLATKVTRWFRED